MNDAKRDLGLIFTAAFLRSVGLGLSGVIFAIYLSLIGVSKVMIGVLISVGITGAIATTLLMPIIENKIGRKGTLMFFSFLMLAGGLALATAPSSVTLLTAACLLGAVNSFGRDRGALYSLEQALIGELHYSGRRINKFALYNLLLDIGHSLGALSAGVVTVFRRWGMSEIGSYQGAFLIYALFFLGCVVLYAAVSKNLRGRSTLVDFSADLAKTRASFAALPDRDKRIIVRLSALSFMDGSGSAFIVSSVVSYFFFEKFGIDPANIGIVFFAARLLNGLSYLAASWLASRFNVLNTMVWTHFLSGLALLSVPLMPTSGLAITLYLLRESISEMDVPCRQTLVTSLCQDRVLASSITNSVRLTAWGAFPALAGVIMQYMSIGASLATGALVKMTHDILLLQAFKKEEKIF
jgi:MFS family permease